MGDDQDAKTERLLFNSNKTLTILTKVRGATAHIDAKPMDLLPWPLHFERDKSILDDLAAIGVNPRSDVKAKAWNISYDEYRRLDGIEILNILETRAVRDCVEVGRLRLLASRPRSIALLWDFENPDPESIPRSTSDSQAIDALTIRRDAQFSFEGTHDGTRLKLPAYLGPLVFNEMNLFPGQEIRAKDRQDLSGVGADATGRGKRVIVSTDTLPEYHQVVDMTLANVKAVLPVEPWLEQVRQVSIRHHEAKTAE